MENTLNIDYIAVGVWLRTSPEIRAYLEDLGKKGVEYAKSIAPVGSRVTKHSVPGQYRDSLKYEIRVGRSRMYLRIYSDDFTAWWVEYGSKHNTKRAVLRRTLDYLATGHAAAAATYGGIAEYDAANLGTHGQRSASRRARAVQAGRKGA